jgi:hypothetical protein
MGWLTACASDTGDDKRPTDSDDAPVGRSLPRQNRAPPRQPAHDQHRVRNKGMIGERERWGHTPHSGTNTSANLSPMAGAPSLSP